MAISYTLPTGCVTSTNLTVNPLPVISGQTSICLGLPSPLVGNIPGGTWTSSNPAFATIGSSSGLVSGVALGTSVITYTLPTGCFSTTTVSVNPPPAPVTGTMHVCQGLTTTLSGVGGGGWYSSNPAVASVGFGTGVVSGVSVGTATITYSLGTSCISLATVTVNPLPSAITGTFITCPGVSVTLADITPLGAWSSSNTALATVGSGTGIVTGVSGGSPTITYTVLATGCIATKPVTVNPIASITGANHMCTGLTVTLGDSLTGGTWASASPGVAAIGSSSGIVSGISVGTAVITYTLPTGCYTTSAMTVNLSPAAITGNDNVCIGSTYSFTDATTGGTWSSSNPSVAIVGPGTGMVTGSTLGTSVIAFTLPTGCVSTSTVTVDPLPLAITGTPSVCVGLTTTLYDSTAGGSWSSSSLTMATVGSGTGVVTGVAAGYPVITYTLPTGCTATSSVAVKPLPTVHTVTGGGSYCSGGTGMHIGLSGSDSGINYQLYMGTSTVGSPMGGTGSALDFGLHTAAGTYTVVATNTVTLCTKNMTGSVTIMINALPNIIAITGGGHYCVGDTGRHIGLGGSDTGINYQLYRGTTTVGSALSGIGYPLDFGLQTVPGNYTVVAANVITGCTSNMLGTAVIAVDTLYTPSVTVSISPTSPLQTGDTVKLTAHVTGGGATIKYQWIDNITYIAGATNATYSSNAFFNKDSVTCFVIDSSACGSNITPVSVILRIHDVAVQPVNFEGSNLKLIPNPNNGLFTITGSLGITADEVVSLEITNMLGQVIYKHNAATSNGELNEQIMLEKSLANGMYLLNVRSGTENKVFHFVMER